LLASKTIQDAVTIATSVGSGSAYGFCANIASSRDTEEMWSLEVGPGREQSNVHVHKIPTQSNTTQPCHYIRTNHCKHLTSVEQRPDLRSSKARLHRAEELPAPRTMSDIRIILGDTQHEQYPIYRTPRPTDTGATVSTSVFDLINRRMDVYVGNVRESQPPLLSMSLP
jgi:hypothetical protein